MPTRNYWQSYTPTVSLEGLAEFNRQKEIEKENRLIGLKHLIETQGRQLAEENTKDYLTESNDNAWIGYNYTQPKAKNKHLHRQNVDKMMHTKEDVEAMTLGGIAPLAVMSAPLWGPSIIAGGDALASSALGKVITKGLTNPYTNAFITSTFGAHGLNHAINEGIDGWGDAAVTALEIAPLGGLVNPIYKGIVQPGMRLFNSPLTGNWTKIGNREYKLSPNSLGVNNELVTRNNNTIKLADEITYDDTGSIIPLSQRDNFGSNDIRFSNTSNSNNANRYLNSDGSWNWLLIHQETRNGVTEARNFLKSDIKATSDAHNKELAERIGFNGFESYAEAQKRASVPIAPEFYPNIQWEGEPHAGLTVRFANNPEKDRMLLSLSDNVNHGGFHETLHRGYYGEAGPGAQRSATEQLYNFKKDKLLAPITEDNAEWVNYLSQVNGGEAATNAIDIGNRMGIAPGTPWPGRKKAMELFEKYASSSDTKTNAFNAFNWKQKPRRIWDAITGRYFALGGAISTSAFIDK